jgi:hypothetical protein
MYPDIGRFDVILAEPVTVERGVISSVLHGVAYPFIDKSVEITAFQRLNFLIKERSHGHYRELLEGWFIDCEACGVQAPFLASASMEVNDGGGSGETMSVFSEIYGAMQLKY